MWTRETATVREILDLLHEAGRPLAYTTVMTVMSRLTSKGLLTREPAGKAHAYRPAMTQETFLRAASAHQVQTLVERFGDLAIAQFLAEANRLSPERRCELAQLLAGELERGDEPSATPKTRREETDPPPVEVQSGPIRRPWHRRK
ncbi:MAG: BlaI/MecI/CopY family transcriptional regulator [Thermomicrobiales bacterium]